MGIPSKMQTGAVDSNRCYSEHTHVGAKVASVTVHVQ